MFASMIKSSLKCTRIFAADKKVDISGQNFKYNGRLKVNGVCIHNDLNSVIRANPIIVTNTVLSAVLSF